MRQLHRRIGKYEIKSILGEGATGVVFEGYDPDIQRRVAIKTLHPHLLTGKVGAGLLARFKREAISAAKCIHPNIVTILEYGQHDGRPFIAMEFVNGISVQKFMKRRQRMGRGISLKRTLTIISGLLNGLHAAHRFGIVHRDVKASNVLITRGSGQIKLADFGMARLAENSDLTMIGSLIGTPRYMAPELRFGLEADARADVFSATRLFLELLRMLPESTRATRSRLPEIADIPPGNRIDYTTKYPTAFIPVIIKGLHADRSERYQTVSELMQAIKDAMPGLYRQPEVSVEEEATPVEAVEEDLYSPSDGEVDSLTSLLIDYLGPIGEIIMADLETRASSMDNLVLELAREIPGRDKQQEFLRRWQSISLARQEAFGDHRQQQKQSNPSRLQADTPMLNRIGHGVANYFEPISKTLFGHGSNRSDK